MSDIGIQVDTNDLFHCDIQKYFKRQQEIHQILNQFKKLTGDIEKILVQNDKEIKELSQTLSQSITQTEQKRIQYQNLKMENNYLSEYAQLMKQRQQIEMGLLEQKCQREANLQELKIKYQILELPEMSDWEASINGQQSNSISNQQSQTIDVNPTTPPPPPPPPPSSTPITTSKPIISNMIERDVERTQFAAEYSESSVIPLKSSSISRSPSGGNLQDQLKDALKNKFKNVRGSDDED